MMSTAQFLRRLGISPPNTTPFFFLLEIFLLVDLAGDFDTRAVFVLRVFLVVFGILYLLFICVLHYSLRSLKSQAI